MKKLLLSLATLAAISSGAMAQEVLYDLQFGSDVNVAEGSGFKYYPKNGSYTETFTYKLTESEQFTVANFNNNQNGWTDMIKCGRKNNASTGMITTDFAVPYSVTSVTVKINKLNEANILNYVSLQSSADGNTWTDVAKITSVATGELTLAPSTPAANLYYRVNFDCSAAKGNGVVWLNSVKYNGVKSGADVKKAAGISFAASSMYAMAKQPVTAPEFSNPNNLPVKFESSAPTVVSVSEDGTIMAKTVGEAIISATTEETDEYYAGNVSYEVNVVNNGNNYANFIKYSANEGDVLGVTMYFTVVYQNGAYIYATDYMDRPVLFYDFNNTYKPGDLLATGYYVQYAPYNGLPEWKFVSALPKAMSNDPLPAFTEYDAVTMDMTNTVLILKNVTVDAATPAEKNKNFNVTLADGTTLQFRNQWAMESVQPGTYNVKGAVGRFNDNLQFYPISYEAAVADPEYPANITATSDATDKSEFKYTPAATEDDMNTLTADLITTGDNVTVTLDVPEGWTGWMHSPIDTDVNIGGEANLRKAPSYEWYTVADMKTLGYVEGNSFTVKADDSTREIQLFLVNGEKVCSNYPVFFELKVSKAAVAVDPEMPASYTADLANVTKVFKNTFLTATENPYGVPAIDIEAWTPDDSVEITLQIPEGWTTFMIQDEAAEWGDVGGGPDYSIRRAPAYDWTPVADYLPYGFKLGNSLVVKADSEEHEIMVFPVYDNKFDFSTQFSIYATFKKEGTDSVNEINVADEEAEYYTLQGVKVENPANGVYVKVAGGKATKVIVK